MYEPLVGRGKKLELVPLLATTWKQTAPTVWRFNLRPTSSSTTARPFTADDVIFSLRARKADGSDMKTYVAPIKEIRKIDDLHRRHRDQRAVPDPARHDQPPGTS